VLIDPAYEVKSDYRDVVRAMRDALERFQTGTYAVWYPHLQKREADELPAKLRRLATGDWLDVSLDIAHPAPGGLGLHGSGLFVFNPPWKLEAELRSVLPTLMKLLARDPDARFDVQSRQT